MEKRNSDICEGVQINPQSSFILVSQDDETIHKSIDGEGKTDCAFMSTRGKKYEKEGKPNEDRIFTGKVISENGEIASVDAVCDGLGGYERGADAAQYFCEGLQEECLKKYDVLAESFSADFMENVIYRVLIRYRKEKMSELSGSTFVVSIITKDQIILMSLGDSKGFLFSPNGDLIVETKDHKSPEFSDRFRLSSHMCLLYGDDLFKNIRVKTKKKKNIPKNSILILTSDGITDNLLVSREQRSAVPYLSRLIKEKKGKINPSQLCSDMFFEAKRRMALKGTEDGSFLDVKPDNASAMVRVLF